MEEKKYEHNGKTVKIVPMKRVKKTEGKTYTQDGEKVKIVPVKKEKKAEQEKGQAKFAVDDKVSLKNIPAEYSGFGFAESVVIKVFKSTHDHEFRYTIRSSSGQELALLKENQIKHRKTNFQR